MTPTNINEVKEAWQPFYQEELTDDDAVEITNNLSRFFRWIQDQKNKNEGLVV